jgi:hypothetical protein
MDGLKRLRDEELHSRLRSEIAKQLHTAYDAVLKDELPPQLKDLMRHIDQTQH